MLAIALALVVAAAPAGPFDGHYAPKGAPAECKLPEDNPDTFARFTATAFDQYEAHCRWGPLKAGGSGVWTAKGHCSIEGNDTPGSFRFTVKGDTLAMKGPDGVTSDFKRCPAK